MNVSPRFAVSILAIGVLLACPSLFAEGNKKPAKIFSNNNEMDVVLSGPWATIRHHARKDALYPAQLTYTGEDGQRHTIDVKAAPRGITRRLRVCDFPPLKIHFDKEKMKGTEFRGNKSLKLVTYCKTNSKYEQYYVKEYLVYQIYNLITEYSFKAQPMMIEYKESKSGKSIKRFSFLIEDADEVADRHDLEKLTIARVPHSQLDPVQTSYYSLFQFLIGNLDWAATDGPDKNKCCHNSKLIGKSVDENPKYVIPYDFDSSGMVNAHYAAPPDGLNVRNIRQRLFRGFCSHNNSLSQAVARFNEKKTDILALFKDNSHLNNNIRKNAIAYIEDFYEIINDPKKFEKQIIGKCRGSVA